MKRLFGEAAVEEIMNYKIERGGKIADDYIASHQLGDKK